ncbi:MAG: pseudouridine synthase, partial [Bacteroidales bacterium]|nr:pseudouridine synthase [Bacteroidales bacterium]
MEERRENRSWKRPEKTNNREFRIDEGFRMESNERKRSFRRDEERSERRNDFGSPRGERRERKSGGFSRERNNDKPSFRSSYSNRERGGFGEEREERPRRQSRSFGERESNEFSRRSEFGRDSRRGSRERSGFGRRDRKEDYSSPKNNYFSAKPNISSKSDGLIRLNKYISNSGVCSRREADVLIATGAVTVNGEVITQMGYKVKDTDVVCYDGEKLSNERKVYLLLNKPKGFITTLDDPQERKTVMNLVGNACEERIYPVGRLDRNTCGLLLFTNDGELTKKLTHPSFGARKIYHVELDKPLTKADMQTLLDGVELEDGLACFDDIQYVENANSKKIVGVELHSGKNRIVRRMFNHLDYRVEKLDRVCFAGLTKKNLSRGHYRFLTEKEVAFLKM